jgi:hypothetical protein
MGGGRPLSRGDDPVLTQRAGQQPGHCGQHRSIRPGWPRPSTCRSNTGTLCRQHQHFRHDGGIGSGQKREPAEHPRHDPVEQSYSHESDHASVRRNASSRPIRPVLARYRLCGHPLPPPPADRAVASSGMQGSSTPRRPTGQRTAVGPHACPPHYDHVRRTERGERSAEQVFRACWPPQPAALFSVPPRRRRD